MNFQAARGTYDVLPSESYKWHYFEKVVKEVSNLFNYKEIRTPIFENTNLFVRSVGETTDIVSKEMYTFDDRKNRSLTLRPEGTACVARSYVEHKLYTDPIQPSKFFYYGPMFRYERMQKGRYRQFVQFGAELIGAENPSSDAEIIAYAYTIFTRLGIKKVRIAINTLGDQESRANYRDSLINHFKPHVNELCGDCQKRLENNPLRVLDCKVDSEHPLMKSAPKLIDYLNEESNAYFKQVLEYLDDLGIEYVLDHNLVRGLDYYNHTVFELIAEVEGFGKQSTLCGGGRYNGMVEQLGGPETAAIGFAFGVERLLMAMEAENVEIPRTDILDAYIIALGENAKKRAVKLVYDLRQAGIKVDIDYLDRKFKSQLKQADRLEVPYAIIIGENELDRGSAIVKYLNDGSQDEVRFGDLGNYFSERRR